MSVEHLQSAIAEQVIWDLTEYCRWVEREAPEDLEVFLTSQNGDSVIEEFASAARWLMAKDPNPHYPLGRTMVARGIGSEGDRLMSAVWYRFTERQRELILGLLEAAGIRIAPGLRLTRSVA